MSLYVIERSCLVVLPTRFEKTFSSVQALINFKYHSKRKVKIEREVLLSNVFITKD